MKEIQAKQAEQFIYNCSGYKNDFSEIAQVFKQVSTNKINFEMGFKSPQLLETFTRILNREIHEQKITNEYLLTYHQFEKGKMTRVKKQRNENFTQMATLKFGSTYLAHIFLKFYENTLKQMEFEYQYQLILNTEGTINIYMKNDKKISSMFSVQISNMKRKLKCVEVKTKQQCQKMIYSEKLVKTIQKAGIQKEVWFKLDRDPILILYSDKHSQKEMKNILFAITQPDITIMKFLDKHTSFAINCMIFERIIKHISPQILKIRKQFDIDIQFNYEKLAIIIHNVHYIWREQIKTKILAALRQLVVIIFKGRQIRQFYNYIKAQNTCSSISATYSKKVVCLCINRQKIPSRKPLEKVFNKMTDLLNQETQICFNWLHLKQAQFDIERKTLSQKFLNMIANTKFSLQNFEGLTTLRDYKAVLRIKQVGFKGNNKSILLISNSFINLVLLNFQNVNQTEVLRNQLQVQQAQLIQESLQNSSNQQNDEDSMDQSQNSIDTVRTQPQNDKNDKKRYINLNQMFSVDVNNIKYFETKQNQNYQNESQKILWKAGKRSRNIEYQLKELFNIEVKVRQLRLSQTIKQKNLSFNRKDLCSILKTNLQKNAKELTLILSEKELKIADLQVNKQYCICSFAYEKVDGQNQSYLVPFYQVELLE